MAMKDSWCERCNEGAERCIIQQNLGVEDAVGAERCDDLIDPPGFDSKRKKEKKRKKIHSLVDKHMAPTRPVARQGHSSISRLKAP